MKPQFEFFTKQCNKPYIDTLLSYDLSGSEGCIHFDGYYYVNNDKMNNSLPLKLYMKVWQAFSEPIYTDLSGGQRVTCEDYEENFYYAEFYKRQKLCDTNTYDELDGMRVCYFPTMEQKLYFRVLKEYKTIGEVFDDIDIQIQNDTPW